MRRLIIGFILLSFHYLALAQALNPGTIGNDQTIPYHSIPAGLSFVTLPSGGTSPYTYQWQRSFNSGVTYLNIPNAISESYNPTVLNATTLFRCRVTDATLAINYTNSVTITVWLAGTIGNNQTIPYHSIPAPLSFISPPSGGTAPYSYQWQRSYNSGVSYLNIPNAISETYNPTFLNTTTFYRCMVTDAALFKNYTNAVNITVLSSLIAGTIGNSGFICYNTAPAGLTGPVATGGTPPYSYQWQYSINGLSWSNIEGATLLGYSPAALTVSTWFRRSVSDAIGRIVASNSVKITVYPDLTPGTIGSAQTICSGATPNALTEIQAASGGSGSYIYQWQSSTDGASFTDIPGEISLGFTPPAVTADTWYRRRVIDGSLCEASSSPVKITVSSISAQLHDNITININKSTNFNVVISGGTSPYTLNYSINGTPQPDITNYTSGTDISTGVLTEGIYTYALTSVTDANGCISQNLGTNIVVTATDDRHYDFSYPNRSSLLTDGWDFIAKTPSGGARDTEQTIGAVVSYDQLLHPGLLRIPVDVGDLSYSYNNTRNTLFHDLPAGWTSMRLKIASFNPTENYQLTGLAVYQDDNNYIQIVRAFSGNDNIVEFAYEFNGSLTSLPSAEVNATTDLHLRLDRDITTGTITAYYSLDNSGWIMVGDAISSLITPRLAILATGDATPGGLPNADIAWAEISTQPLEPIIDELTAYPKELLFSAVEGHPFIGTRSIFISTDLDRTVRWSQSTDVTWLLPDLTNGLTESTLKIGLNTSGLSPGIHQGNITIQSTQITGDPITIQVTVIINPDGLVKVTSWKNGIGGAMSVSTDDGAASGFDLLQQYGFKGTFVCNDVTPPMGPLPEIADYGVFYNAGMEVGSHLVNHHSSVVPTSDFLRQQDIEPSIAGFCRVIPPSCPNIISLVWPSGLTNYRMQAVASEYFLSARGYNINLLEDSTPENFMNLKSFQSYGATPNPGDFISHVNEAITQNKWFNLVLHYTDDDGGAISYASTQNIWVAPIGEVVKYILQRDRFLLTGYITDIDNIRFNASRLAIPTSPYRSFETAFGADDITTLKIDIDDQRIIEGVYIDNEIIASSSYQIRTVNNNLFLFLNLRLVPSVNKAVEIRYVSETIPRIYLNPTSLNFSSYIGTNPASQSVEVSSNLPFDWTTAVGNSTPAWLSVTPGSGSNTGIITVSVNTEGLTAGTYNNIITISSEGASNTPQTVNVSLVVIAPTLAISPMNLSFSAFVNGISPSDQSISIENSGAPGEMTWSVTDDADWLSVSPLSGSGSGVVTISASHTGLQAGIYNGTITINSPQAFNSPQQVSVILKVEAGHYDFTYADRSSLILNGWDFMAKNPDGSLRDTEHNPPVSYDQSAHPGVLRIPVDIGDLSFSYNNTRNTLFRDLPGDWTSIRLKIASFNPTQLYQLAGLVAYQDDNNYVLIARTFDGENRIVSQYETPVNLFNVSETGNSLISDLHFRLDRDIATETITYYYSVNNTDWIPNGSIVLALTNPRLGVLVCGDETPGDYPNAEIAWAEIYTSTGAKSSGNGISLQNVKPAIEEISLQNPISESEEVLLEQSNKLHQNHPNPFSSNTWIEYDLVEDTQVIFELFNSSGHKIETILNEDMKSGSYKFILDANNYPSGIYFLTMKTGLFKCTIKMLLIK